MSVQGIEFAADTAVSRDAIHNAGLAFVVGHLAAGSAGGLTAAAANDFIAAGLTIVSVYDTPQQPTDAVAITYDPGLFEDPASLLHAAAYRAGVADGKSAHTLAAAVGQAAGSAIYFDINADVNAGITYVLDYFRGIAEGFSETSMGHPNYKIGVYGSGYVLDSVFAANLVDYKWLAAPTGWQGSADYAAYDIREYDTADSAAFPGAVVNHDMTSDSKPSGDFGQWGVSTTAANLVIYDLTLRPEPILAGSTATIDFSVGNSGTATAPATTATLYLSTDSTITAADQVLGTFNLPVLVAKAATSAELAWVIPDDTAAGTY